MSVDEIKEKLDVMVPNPRCELEYNKDYELLIAVMLSAQCTDKRVNEVTQKLFAKYSLNELSNIEIFKLEKILYKLGSHHKKAIYTKSISNILINKYDSKVPKSRELLEQMPGVGRKTASVVLAELYNIPTMAVDTHVERVSKRLGIVRKNDNVVDIEKRLCSFFDEEDFNRINHQLVLFGRYICKAIKPECQNCLFKCKNYHNNNAE